MIEWKMKWKRKRWWPMLRWAYTPVLVRRNWGKPRRCLASISDLRGWDFIRELPNTKQNFWSFGSDDRLTCLLRDHKNPMSNMAAINIDDRSKGERNWWYWSVACNDAVNGIVFVTSGRRKKAEYGAMVEWFWQRKIEVLWGNTVPVTFVQHKGNGKKSRDRKVPSW